MPCSSYLVGVCAEWDTKSAGQTKIRELEIGVLVDEQILRFQVTVKNAVCVAVSHSLAQLHHELLDHGIVHDQCLARQT